MSDPFTLDPSHAGMDMFEQEIVRDTWNDKYRWDKVNEDHPHNTMYRCCQGIYPDWESNANEANAALAAMKEGLWMPGGRILAGAGTSKRVTLCNCYVTRTVHDSMEGIHAALGDAMLTLQQGGGIGTDFSTLRPKGAKLVRTGSTASGPLPFMDMWDAMSFTIMSAGHRRGAMMATMSCTHPDIEAFINAKHKKGRLTNFNVSVLVTDPFMKAVEDDGDWDLYFNIPPTGPLGLEKEVNGEKVYVYKTVKARYLWDLIMKSTFEYSEPGVIFIDRVNKLNNLNYCETISCTNPCGEQPLPPHGACNLGAINLARVVKHPFTSAACIDLPLLKRVVSIGVRFLDNVLDVTNWPLEQQSQEGKNKRRIGLGVSGLGNMFQQLMIPYGSVPSLHWTEAVMKTIANEAYKASALLAEERGTYTFFSPEKFNCAFYKKLNDDIQTLIAKYGLRNGVLLTVAPTGTTSLFYGNISSGLEPIFLNKIKRSIVQGDGSLKEYGNVFDYGYLMYCRKFGIDPNSDPDLPDYMLSTAGNVKPSEHVDVQAACQKWVDASISKTINCPKDLGYEDFCNVYTQAYEQGCKGCTTYRPSEMRGAVLEKPDEKPKAKTESEAGMPKWRPTPSTRPRVLQGKTYKVKYPSLDAAMYITINDDEQGRPYEMFIASRSDVYKDWTAGLTRMVSAIMRSGMDIAFVYEELQQVNSIKDGCWIDGTYYGSVIAYIAHILEEHCNGLKSGEKGEWDTQRDVLDNLKNEGVEISSVQGLTHIISKPGTEFLGEICIKCNKPTVIQQEGCKTCLNCGNSNCG